MKLSLEVEYWIVDEDGALVEPGPLTELSSNVEEEFVEPLFELKTPPCEHVDALRSTFVEQLLWVLERADELDRKLVPLGTPLNTGTIDRLRDERSRIQEAAIGDDLAYARYCAGTHLHFEQRNVVDQLNVLLALDPALALCASSPYFQGERVASDARAYVYRKRGYDAFPKHGQLWRYAETVAQWHRRLERRYEEFVAAAVDAGVDEATVADHFTPDDVVWTPVRLREAMPTVEWRSPDAALPSQLLRLAADIEAVMEALHHGDVRVDGATGRVTDDEIVLPEFEALCDLAEAAMHDGLADPAVADYLDRMGFSVEEYHPISARIDGRAHVPKSDARSLRLEYADRLERDVEALARAVEA